MQMTKFLKPKTKLILKHLTSLFILMILFLCLFGSSHIYPVKAQGWWETAQQGGLNQVGSQAYGQGSNPQDIRDIIARIVSVFLGLLGIIFTILIFYAGYRWMTAGGNEDKVKQAKDQLTAGIIGLAIILASAAISHFVFKKILFTTTGTEAVW